MSKPLALLLAVLICCAFALNLWAGHVPFSRHNIDSAFDRFHAVHAADVDGDGDMDILGASFGDDAILWWQNLSGDGSQWSEHVIDDSFWVAISVRGADIDGDGDVDVLGAAYLDNDITWWENVAGDETAWAEHTVDGDFTGVNTVRAVDMDMDGDLDILGSAQDANAVTWWENTAGDGSFFAKHIIDADFVSAKSVDAADVDGDGDPDVVGAAFETDQIAWWENTSGDATAWSRSVVDSNFDVANFVIAADLDGDADIDILGVAERDDEVAWWENITGTGKAWARHTVDGSFDQANSVHAADVDGDGDMDILATALRANDIAWWENAAGNGSAWTRHTLSGNFDGISVWTTDVDGDQDIDVIGAAVEPGEIAWWENETFQPGTGFVMDPGLNGNWFKFERNGEGGQFELADDGSGGLRFVATIYSYSPGGGQIFMIAVGPATGDTAEVDVFITNGGVWGDGYDPKLVSINQWGTGTFTAHNCDSIHMSLRPGAKYLALGYTNLEYDMVRLATPVLPCPADISD